MAFHIYHTGIASPVIALVKAVSFSDDISADSLGSPRQGVSDLDSTIGRSAIGALKVLSSSEEAEVEACCKSITVFFSDTSGQAIAVAGLFRVSGTPNHLLQKAVESFQEKSAETIRLVTAAEAYLSSYRGASKDKALDFIKTGKLGLQECITRISRLSRSMTLELTESNITESY